MERGNACLSSHGHVPLQLQSINAFLPQIIQYMDIPSFTVYLLAESLITHDERELVLSRGRRDCQVPELLRLLKTKGAGWYERFRSALEKAASGPDPHLGHQHLLEVLPRTFGRNYRLTLQEPAPLHGNGSPDSYVACPVWDPDTLLSTTSTVSSASVHTTYQHDHHLHQRLSMLRKFDFSGISQQCHALGEFAAEVGREVNAVEVEVAAVAEENRALCEEKGKMEERLNALEEELEVWRRECEDLRERNRASERGSERLRKELDQEVEGCARELILTSAETEDVQQLKSLASRSTNRCPLRKESPLAHLKIAFLADFQEEGHENGMTPSTFDLCTQALESLLGRSQSVSVDSLGVPMEIVYPDCNVKVSVAMEDIGGLLEKSMPKLPFVPDLLLCLFNSLTIFDSIPQLTNVLSPNLWERCVILVPNDPVAIYAKRPFIKLLKQAGICPQTVAKIPFVLLPSADPDSPLHRIRRTSEIFTTCIERAHCASKLALVSLNKCRVSAAFRVNYTQLPANLAECPIALTNWQAERVLSQTETRVQHKCCKLTIGALKLTAPIMGKLCSTMV